LPVFKALKTAFPSCYLEVVARNPAAFLAKEAGLIDDVVSLETQEHLFLFHKDCKVSESEAKKLSSFDIIISYLNDHDKIAETRLKSLCKNKVLTQSPFPKTKHISEHLLEPLNNHGIAINIKNMLPLLQWSKAHKRRGKNLLMKNGLLKKTVIIHPGSGSIKKNFPLEDFIKIYEILKKGDIFDACFLLGEAEENLKKELQKANCKFLYGLPLMEVADVLASSAGYIGNDSGITHLAAALDIPSVAIFCTTSPSLWQPSGSKTKIISVPNATKININPSCIYRKIVQVEALRALLFIIIEF
jgi:ADP-heptose:LPS heptosyltransferase